MNGLLIRLLILRVCVWVGGGGGLAGTNEKENEVAGHKAHIYGQYGQYYFDT